MLTIKLSILFCQLSIVEDLFNYIDTDIFLNEKYQKEKSKY